MQPSPRFVWIGFGMILVLYVFLGLTLNPARIVSAGTLVPAATPRAAAVTSRVFIPMVIGSGSSPIPSTAKYIILGWNDLGMHCYNRDFSDLAVLPPFNNLWVQVIQVGDPPKIITSGISVSYSFPDNTISSTKSNFWTNAKALFGVDLAPNIGLTGKGLAGNMDLSGDHFEARGIPLTEFRDSAPTTPYPYQLANLVATDLSTGKVIATQTVVAPVSTEMRCDNCHSDGQINGIATGKVERNILTLHDQKFQALYPAGNTTPLMDRRPVLCAGCHSSNALGAPGVAGVMSLSNAMHTRHTGIVQDSLNGCYSCHPGPTTQCLRDTMKAEGLTCIDCHGGLAQVSKNANPWLNEPKCTNCHDGVTQDNALYRLSKGHGGVYCEGCHDSTHAIAPSSQANDQIKFINLQGAPGPLHKCTVCHLTQPSSGGFHQ
jgi:hypothetical protein